MSDPAEEVAKRFTYRDRPGRKPKVFPMQKEEPRARLPNGSLPYGMMSRLLEFAVQHPGMWCMSEPQKNERVAVQSASDIRRCYRPIWTSRFLEVYGGRWRAEWGLKEDQYGIMQYRVWVMHERRDPENKGRNQGRREDDVATERQPAKRKRRSGTTVSKKER